MSIERKMEITKEVWERQERRYEEFKQECMEKRERMTKEERESQDRRYEKLKQECVEKREKMTKEERERQDRRFEEWRQECIEKRERLRKEYGSPPSSHIPPTIPRTMEQATQTATSSKCEASIQTDMTTSTADNNEEDLKELRRKLEEQGRAMEALEQQVRDMEELQEWRTIQRARPGLRPLFLATHTITTSPSTTSLLQVSSPSSSPSFPQTPTRWIIPPPPSRSPTPSLPLITSPIFPPGLPHPPQQLDIPPPPVEPLPVSPQSLRSAQVTEGHSTPTLTPLFITSPILTSPPQPPPSLSPLPTLLKTPGDRSALLILDADTQPPMALTWPLLLADSDRLATIRSQSYLRSQLRPNPEPPPIGTR
jgi:hypothetical protein